LTQPAGRGWADRCSRRAGVLHGINTFTAGWHFCGHRRGKSEN